MNRTEELRQELIAEIEKDILTFTEWNLDHTSKMVMVGIKEVTAKRTVELLKKLEVPINAKWHYYTNDEGRPRWKCTNCGKIVRREPTEKKRCSRCGAYMNKEA